MPQDPVPAGDIGRRLALRREELGLTREEVAERAGIAAAYLRYVEEEPTALPGPTFMLRVADALESTVPQLRGGAAGMPPGMGEAAVNPVFTPLGRDECLALLSDHGVGRVAVTTEDGPAILPVNYAVEGGTIAFRTAPTAAPSATVGRDVAFEVDRVDEALSEGWSVLVLGPATQVTEADDVRRLRARARSAPWAGGDREMWVRISPVRITGRRIRAGSG
ncbi:pyridoxamine 5'-phosphate oxidase family protein [Streptomyces cocklensis]|jgi:nitroimidazol reductase NimA-like FMN-containing flavoprotein (pyridoxamine 5'-phosphate oxidase superfamily)|uniref:HTH cro/C1-type domain-containing protein n=1 Tax=Actinacidiphila cocklensis TaxID=887465 RepID=A0A9W4DTA6_9ACTN|nr:pyridoxamine 5'-phosphate oxidase family protein [Actinacidiphila cocklensis]MDD1059906.1 pyridoxamine 5'-phosphate oxidase family protein [Actinacidiphila cocklensis]WSX72769.1 pyridoxamine 5'-phosphate oxidase family protein [Streptomyces sp. NBC_00899]WSX81163.1 pyridoxamine 5'-phosphate oxidase family protein [Streptomyces sp. NBC_00899]CAG6395853.1 HTH cro/C1-type domain-containing protein [Actinacidiphila cocklensis]